MTNNEILKKITIAHNLRRKDALEVFEMAGLMYGYNQVGNFLLKPDNRRYVELEQEDLTKFLDALIVYSRGSLEQPQIPARSILNYILNLAERDEEEALENIIECVNKAKEAMKEARDQEGQESEEE
ncbi:MAG: DUF1456 family protein [Lentisphaeraceae bacterium]|nr:DUF1456 family protein [Lentisphaeraceae bacterium]